MIKFLKRMVISGSGYLSYSGSRRYVQYAELTIQKKAGKRRRSWNYRENRKLTTGWKKINGSWYHFKDNGTMSTGWVKDGLHWVLSKGIRGDADRMAKGKWNMVLFGEFRGL